MPTNRKKNILHFKVYRTQISEKKNDVRIPQRTLKAPNLSNYVYNINYSIKLS